MVLPIYLAMTGAEYRRAAPPSPIAWMACQFSSRSAGLSNMPPSLPSGSIIILNDRVPPDGHDEARAAGELAACVERTGAESVLLDFERPHSEHCARMAQRIASTLPCPVAVTPPYIDCTEGPVFLPPVPPHLSLSDYLKPWQGRELWLDLAPETEVLTLTKDGCSCRTEAYSEPDGTVFTDSDLCCRYSIRVNEVQAVFTLCRHPDDLVLLLEKGNALGVTRGLGLYQEFRPFYLST